MTSSASRTRAWAVLAALTLCGSLAACTGGAGHAPRTPSGTNAAEVNPLVATSTLIYRRSSLNASDSPPDGFRIIRDYPSSTEIEQVVSTWNVDTQTLTALVTVTLKSENVVYVVDGAVPAEAATPIEATQAGRLHEVTCPANVSPQHACYLLQVLH